MQRWSEIDCLRGNSQGNYVCITIIEDEQLSQNVNTSSPSRHLDSRTKYIQEY